MSMDCESYCHRGKVALNLTAIGEKILKCALHAFKISREGKRPLVAVCARFARALSSTSILDATVDHVKTVMAILLNCLQFRQPRLEIEPRWRGFVLRNRVWRQF